MENNIDVENHFIENPEGDVCFMCGKYFKFYELQLYRRTEGNDEYICFNCGDVFRD